MYLKHWGLNESPFRGGIDPRQYFTGSAQEEALARMQFLVTERRRLGLLLGEPGTGKSLLLNVLKRDLETTGARVALVSLLGVEADELATLVASALKLPTSANPWAAISTHVAENRLQQLSTVLLLDDVNAPAKALRDQIARLVQLDLSPTARFTALIAATPDNVSKLGLRLLELAELRIDLDSWTREEAASYLETSLRAAGSTRPIFDAQAIDRLYDLSGGYPRRIKQLADLALLAGAGQQLVQIDPDTVEAATHELGVVML